MARPERDNTRCVGVARSPPLVRPSVKNYQHIKFSTDLGIMVVQSSDDGSASDETIAHKPGQKHTPKESTKISHSYDSYDSNEKMR